MNRLTWTLALLGVILGLSGCGKTPQDASPATAEASTNELAAPAIASTAVPGEVVAKFYDALKVGDERTIAALLTDKAREETSRSGLDIRPQGDSTLSYAIGETEILEDGAGAHVMTLWTESPEPGQTASTEVIWVLRRQASGWRLAGMATQIAEDQLPVLFNFEDPEEMLRRREYAAQSLAEQEQAPPAVQQASHSEALPAGNTQLR